MREHGFDRLVQENWHSIRSVLFNICWLHVHRNFLDMTDWRRQWRLWSDQWRSYLVMTYRPTQFINNNWECSKAGMCQYIIRHALHYSLVCVQPTTFFSWLEVWFFLEPPRRTIDGHDVQLAPTLHFQDMYVSILPTAPWMLCSILTVLSCLACNYFSSFWIW